MTPPSVTRRRFLSGSITALAGGALAVSARHSADEDKALVAITLDMEMAANFPTWEQTHWNYEKGNLNAEAKKYTVEACRRVKANGGVLHCFAVGRTLEQENVDWLKGIIKAGHPVGNHTYDHVNVTATRLRDIQFRFQRAPWLLKGSTPLEVIRENIRLANVAMKDRLGIAPAGFRTPGGFANGLRDRADVRQILKDLGFTWISSLYPPHPNSKPGEAPTEEVFAGIVKRQQAAQPFVYPDGLIEVPMNPISDIGAFRNGRWKLASFLKAIRLAVEWTIEHRAVFDFLAHPSCLYVTDPEFKAVDLICDLVRKAGRKAALVDLGTIAQRAQVRK